jgi:hypothetical protein
MFEDMVKETAIARAEAFRLPSSGKPQTAKRIA